MGVYRSLFTDHPIGTNVCMNVCSTVARAIHKARIPPYLAADWNNCACTSKQIDIHYCFNTCWGAYAHANLSLCSTLSRLVVAQLIPNMQTMASIKVLFCKLN